jgi:hypothetical protein
MPAIKLDPMRAGPCIFGFFQNESPGCCRVRRGLFRAGLTFRRARGTLSTGDPLNPTPPDILNTELKSVSKNKNILL